jgi:hypothetical protein
MTDDRFEQDLHGALGELMAESASPELRQRVGQVLAQPSGPRAPAFRPRLAWLGAGAGIAAVLVVAAVVAVSRPSTPAPVSGGPSLPVSASATASDSAAASSTPAASATAPASPSQALPPYLAMPVISVTGLTPATTRVEDPATPQDGGAPQGPYVYQQFGTSITVVDATGGSVRAITPPLLAGEGISSAAWSRDWLALVVAGPLDPCGVDERRDRTDWRILAAPLGADGLPRSDLGLRRVFSVVASGASTTQFLAPGELGFNCAHPKAPAIALDGALLASALPADAHHGSAVTVRRLQVMPGLNWSVSFTASHQVLIVAVSQVAVSWVESANGLTNGDKADWSVQEARFGDTGSVAVSIGETASPTNIEPDVVLDGAAVLANRDQFAAVRGSVVRVDDGTLTVVAPESPNRECFALGASGSHVLLECGGTADGTRTWLAVWSPGGGLRAIGADGVPYWIDQAWISGDWLVWSIAPDSSTGGSWLYGSVPLSAFAAIP